MVKGWKKLAGNHNKGIDGVGCMGKVKNKRSAKKYFADPIGPPLCCERLTPRFASFGSVRRTVLFIVTETGPGVMRTKHHVLAVNHETYTLTEHNVKLLTLSNMSGGALYTKSVGN